MAQNGMTIAAKGSVDRPQSSFQRAIQLATAAVKVGERFDNPWLRAIVLSPSVHHFLTTLAFGARDFTSLAATDGKTRKFGDDDVLDRPVDGTVARSLQRQRNRVPVDHDLSDAHRFAAVRPAAPTSYAVIGCMQGPPTESASTYHHGVVFVAIKVDDPASAPNSMAKAVVAWTKNPGNRFFASLT